VVERPRGAFRALLSLLSTKGSILILRSRKLLRAALTLGVAYVATDARCGKRQTEPGDFSGRQGLQHRTALDSPLAKKNGVSDIVKSASQAKPAGQEALAGTGVSILTKDIEASPWPSATSPTSRVATRKVLVTIRGVVESGQAGRTAKKPPRNQDHQGRHQTIYEIAGTDGTGYDAPLGGGGGGGGGFSQDTLSRPRLEAYTPRC